MSNLTDDNMKALASGTAKRDSGIELGYLDNDDPNAAEFTPDISSSSGKPSADPDRSHELEHQTKQLISDNHNFLSDMDTEVEDLYTASNNDDGGGRPQSSGSRDEENVSATREGVMHRPWARGEPGDHHHNLETIPEDSSSSGVWPDYPGFGYDYNEDRKKASRYRFSFCQYNRGWVMISICAIALLAVISLTVKRKQPAPQPADDTVSTQQQELYKAIEYAMNPVWHDRSNGWDGNTYLDAERFCSAMNGRHPCPYAAYCPEGMGKPPLGGVKNEPHGSWAPVSNPQTQNEWVQLGRKDTCELYSNLHGSWGKDNEDDTEETTHIACCLRQSDHPDAGDYPSDIYARPPTLEEDDLSNSPPELDYQSKQELIDLSLRPLWFSVSNGWQGTSYNDGMAFCKSMSVSTFVCPYEAYCPGGPGRPPFQGIQGKEAAEWWAPVYDDQSLLVGVGSMNACIQTGTISDSNRNKVKYILCCSEGHESASKESAGFAEKENLSIGSKQPISKPTTTKVVVSTVNNLSDSSQNTPDSEPTDLMALTKNEQAALDYMDPRWFGRNDGYQGTTHQEAVDFCNSIGDRQLCPAEAYCPNGSPKAGEINPQPLFLKMNAFPSEQWAALALNANSWLLVGTIDGNPKTTCQTYDTVHDGAQPFWGLDGTSTELKEHVMCCLIAVQQEVQVKSSLDISSSPENAVESSSKYWFTRGDYKRHTYESAKEYCSTKIQNGHLCAYEDICPDGPGSSPFSPPIMTTEQWAPVAELNTWVLVGQEENGDFSLSCFTHKELYGNVATFGNPEYEEKTGNIICCGPS